MNVTELLFHHQYAVAATVCRYELQSDPNYAEGHATLATALLAQKKYADACEHLVRAHELGAASKPTSGNYLDELGTALWLLGRRDEAIGKLKSLVGGILNGSITYSRSLPGGVQEALLLWYFGVSRPDPTATEMAFKLFRQTDAASERCSLPGHIVAHIFGELSKDDLLRYADTPGKHTPPEMRGLFWRRQMVLAYFYIATHMRNQGNEAHCAEFMSKCRDLENPVLDPEWYLAVGEPTANGRQS